MRARSRKQIETLELVRFVFADQHGVLRGKTVVASQAAKLMRNGVSMTTTLLAKDTSHRTVFPVFTPGGGFAMPEMQGAADFLMIADPATFQVLPWAPNTGWVLCDMYFPERQAGAVLDAPALPRRAVDACAPRASIFSPGSKSNFISTGSRIRALRRPMPPGRASRSR